MFDGTLARATGKASKFGAFMDSTFDKLGEILVFIGCIAALAELERRDGADPGGRRRDGRIDHGQLHPGEVRRPRLFLRHGPGRGRHHAPRGPPRDHLARHRPHRDEHRHLGPRVRPRRSSSSVRSSPSSSGSSTSSSQAKSADNPPVTTTTNGARRAREHQRQERQGRQQRRHAEQHLGGCRPAQGRQDPGRHRRRRQLREQPRPGPLLLRERQEGRLRPGPDARRPRRLSRQGHRVRGGLRHRQEQGRQGPVRGDLHQAEQHLRLPAGRARSA